MIEQEELLIKIHGDYGFQLDRFSVTIPKEKRNLYIEQLKKLAQELSRELINE